MKIKSLIATAAAVLLACMPARSQTWTNLWNGTDFTGLYTYDVANGRNDNPVSGPTSLFKIQTGEIFYAAAANTYLATKMSYSRYRVRVDYRFGAGCNLTQYCKNSGLLYHIIQDGMWPSTFVGIESNMYNGWPTALMTINTGVRIYDLRRASFGDTTMAQYASTTNWNTMEVTVNQDSITTHAVNGQTGVIARGLTAGAAALKAGRIALQGEGNDVYFRNFQIIDQSPTPIAPETARRFSVAPSLSALLSHASPGTLIRIWDLSGRLVLSIKTEDAAAAAKAHVGIHFAEISSGGSPRLCEVILP